LEYILLGYLNGLEVLVTVLPIVWIIFQYFFKSPLYIIWGLWVLYDERIRNDWPVGGGLIIFWFAFSVLLLGKVNCVESSEFIKISSELLKQRSRSMRYVWRYIWNWKKRSSRIHVLKTILNKDLHIFLKFYLYWARNFICID